ncbi:hypothetical protein M3Y95_00246400 [Aphelenchoides besseyi]|nr:hypothetical protein M3Y95_00246400 [Aphelenchoides besseyi]
MIPSLRDIEQLDESTLSEQLTAQIADTLKTERELAVLVKQRDEWKRKAEQIQKLQEGNKGVMTETIHKLVNATRHLDLNIKKAEENIRMYTETDPQQTARDIRNKSDEIRSLNTTLRLEREAKVAVCNFFTAQRNRKGRQLPIITETEINNKKNLNEILEQLESEKGKTRGKRWTEVRSIAALPKLP